MNRAGGSLFARDGTTTASRYLDSYLMRMRLDRILPIVLITLPNSLSYFSYKKKKEKEKKEVKKRIVEDNRSILSLFSFFFFLFNNVIIKTKEEGDYA